MSNHKTVTRIVQEDNKIRRGLRSFQKYLTQKYEASRAKMNGAQSAGSHTDQSTGRNNT